MRQGEGVGRFAVSRVKLSGDTIDGGGSEAGRGPCQSSVGNFRDLPRVNFQVMEGEVVSNYLPTEVLMCLKYLCKNVGMYLDKASEPPLICQSRSCVGTGRYSGFELR